MKDWRVGGIVSRQAAIGGRGEVLRTPPRRLYSAQSVSIINISATSYNGYSYIIRQPIPLQRINILFHYYPQLSTTPRSLIPLIPGYTHIAHQNLPPHPPSANSQSMASQATTARLTAQVCIIRTQLHRNAHQPKHPPHNHRASQARTTRAERSARASGAPGWD